MDFSWAAASSSRNTFRPVVDWFVPRRWGGGMCAPPKQYAWMKHDWPDFRPPAVFRTAQKSRMGSVLIRWCVVIPDSVMAVPRVAAASAGFIFVFQNTGRRWAPASGNCLLQNGLPYPRNCGGQAVRTVPTIPTKWGRIRLVDVGGHL